MLTRTDKDNILKLSRQILEKSARNAGLRRQSRWAEELFPACPVSDNSPVGAFVTLRGKKSKDLRGCMGTIEPGLPILPAIARLTMQSAFGDPRFPPMAESELNETEIEISILSPMKRVKSTQDIVPNVHGVFVKRGINSGIFLPQVWEQLPGKEDFLNELCISKAGLSPNVLNHPDTEIFVFTVDHFSEDETLS